MRQPKKICIVRRAGAIVIVTLIALRGVEAQAQLAGDTSVASVDSAGALADASSREPAVSANGVHVAFESDATNLVSGDTNGDGDIFVRAHDTGVTERVSVTWKGQEARGDSRCPAISDDGRYVAFLSNAWNMYAGGANLGSPRWDVYLRDRDAGSTTRLSVAGGGGDPGSHSSCPEISRDGGRVVFASLASNLVAADGDNAEDVYVWDRSSGTLEVVSIDVSTGVAAGGSQPAISGDGKIVAFASEAKLIPDARPNDSTLIYVRDLGTDTTTIASRNPNSPGFPLVENDNSDPSLSDDGRQVVFLSRSATYGGGTTRPRIVLHDRIADTWNVVDTERPLGPCGPPGALFGCSNQGASAPTISGNGRYVAFASRTTRLLPASYTSGDQVYVFDSLTRRLRRISVDPTGITGDSCSVRPSLSHDGLVLAYSSTSGNLVANAGGMPRVYRSDWRCDGDSCRAASLCPSAPASCEQATRSRMRLRRHPPGGRHTDRFAWIWFAAPLAEPFPDPTEDASYHVCIYTGWGTDLDIAAPVGDGWSRTGSGYRLNGDDSGITAMKVTNGTKRSTIIVKGKGAGLDAPYLPLLADAPGVKIQLHESESGRCWGADFPRTAIEKNDPGNLSTELGRDGQFMARLP